MFPPSGLPNMLRLPLGKRQGEQERSCRVMGNLGCWHLAVAPPLQQDRTEDSTYGAYSLPPRPASTQALPGTGTSTPGTLLAEMAQKMLWGLVQGLSRKIEGLACSHGSDIVSCVLASSVLNAPSTCDKDSPHVQLNCQAGGV